MNRYDELKKHIEENAKLAYDLNYAVAADPELSGCEYRACARYVELCRQMGWPVEENFTKQKTAFRAVVTRPEKAVLKVALLAEYDALPGYGEQHDELAHACGHNWIGAVCAGVGLMFAQMQEELEGTIVIMGTPAEETTGGKCVLVEEGAFDDVDFAFQLHLVQKIMHMSLHLPWTL